MLLIILTPVKELLQARDVSRVQVQLADDVGLGIYPGHAPLLAETVAAPLRYEVGGEEHELQLDAGILHILANEEVVLYVPGELRAQGDLQAEKPESARFERLAQTLLAALDGQSHRAGDSEDDEVTT
ncbi:MAG: hypothetical protein K8R89_07435 [Anaerolineae bacterium]|nr:hypothetical protein [Anaerolineae bacterium]